MQVRMDISNNPLAKPVKYLCLLMNEYILLFDPNSSDDDKGAALPPTENKINAEKQVDRRISHLSHIMRDLSSAPQKDPGNFKGLHSNNL